MKCKICNQTYCEGTEGDVLHHDFTCSLQAHFNRIDKENKNLNKRIIRLKKRDDELTRLEKAGVDNWDGY